MKLVAITLVHRHGARLPTKPLECNLAWPCNSSFWDLYRGQLTPLGVKQAIRLGQEMRKYYHRFFSHARPKDIPGMVKCNSSNVHRTINTAWSFYMGMFPYTNIHFKYLTDRPQTLYKTIEESLNSKGESLGIRVEIEEISGHDNLFHSNKGTKDMIEWQHNNLRQSPEIIAWSQDKQCLELADKLYQITGLTKLAADVNPVERILAIKTVYSDVYVSRVHGQGILDLTNQEFDLMTKIASEFLIRKFVSADNLRCNDRGKMTAGMLSNEIVRCFNEVVLGVRDETFHSYSAHDTSLVALAATFGLKLDVVPKFLAYFLFELWLDEDSGTYHVKIYYNPDPSIYPVGTLEHKYWQDSDQYQWICDTSPGLWTFDQFKTRFSSKEYLKAAMVVKELRSLKQGRQLRMSKYVPDDVRQRYTEMFNYYDRDRSGDIDKEELREILVRLEGIDASDQELDTLMNRFDQDKDGTISTEEFIQTMYGVLSPR